MTGKILSYLKRMRSFLPQKLNRYHYLAVFVFFLTIGFVGFSLPAFAGMTEWILNGFLQFFTWLMLIVANLCIGLTIFFLRFFISIAAYNNYIDVDVVQLGWIMVRDVANMFFVVALLVIAFGTILGIEEYEWKKNLVKLILAAILINFSNLIAQLIIDVAHVFTITFLNAIAATAGGNIINMFKLNEITQMVGGVGKNDLGDLRMELAAGAIAATGFAVLAAVAMGSYAYVMMVRVVVLWGLIILAPGAYILGVLPKTKTYADRWWSEFGKHVVVAPVMVFFLWLSFATLGNGQIAQDIQKGQENTSFQLEQKKYGYTGTEQYEATKLSLSKVTTWESMASFFIAMAFMYYGLKVTQETGATGAGAVGSALEFGKKVATIATGYAAGRWLVGGATSLAKTAGKGVAKGVGWAAYHAPIADISGRVQRGKEFFQRQWQSFEGWRNAPEGLTRKAVWKVDEKTGEGRWEAVKKMVEQKDEHGNVVKDASGNAVMVDSGEYEMEEVELGLFQKWAHHTVIKNAESKKKLEKTEKFAENRKEMLDKSTKGVPTGWFMKPYEQTDASDRFERGRLKAMQERSAAKTEEFEGLGAMAERSKARYQNIVKKGWIYDSIEKKPKKETLSDELAGHKVRAEAVKKRSEEMTERSKKTVSAGAGKGAVEARMRAELTIKALQGETKKIEEQARIGMAKQDIEVAKETNAAIDKLRDDLMTRNHAMNKKDAEKAVVADLLAEGKLTSAQADEYRSRGEGAGVVYRAAAAEKQAHTEAEKLEELVGAKAREYAEGHHGKEEIAEEARLGMEIETNKEAIKQLEDIAKRALEKEGEDAAKKLADDVAGKMAEVPKTDAQTAAEAALQSADEAAKAVVAQWKTEAEAEGKKIEDSRKAEKDTLVGDNTAAQKAYSDLQKDAGYVAFVNSETYKENLAKQKGLEKAYNLETDDTKKATIKAQIDELDNQMVYKVVDDSGATVVDGGAIKARAIVAQDKLVAFNNETALKKSEKAKEVKERVEKVNKPIIDAVTKAQKDVEVANEGAKESEAYKAKVREARSLEQNRFIEHDAAAIALRSAKQKQASLAAKAALEETEKSLQRAALGLNSVHTLFTEEQAFKTGAEAAEAFIKTLKSEHLDKMFEKAGESIKNAAKAGAKALHKLADDDVYVRSLAAQKEEHHKQEAMTISKTAAEALAEAEYVERAVMGLALPSSSLVPIAKRLADGLNSLTSEALGKALTDNLAFLAKETKGGKVGPVKDVMKRAAAFGVVNKVNTEAYIDDAIGEMAKQINRLEAGEFDGAGNEDEKAKYEHLREIWEDELQVITRDSSKKKGEQLFGLSNAKNAGLVQNYAISGGDVEQVKQHRGISDISDKKKADGGTEGNYEEAARKYFSDKGGDDAAKAYLDKMKDNDTFLKEAASAFKAQALAAGHSENGAHQKFDSSLGFHRMSTEKEATAIMEAEMRKRGSKVNYQYHSLGDVNTATGVMTRVDREQYARILGSAKTYLDIKSIQDRTRDGVLGYQPSKPKLKDKDGKGLLGGTISTIKESFGSLKNFLENVLIPEVAGGAESFGLIAQLGFGNVTPQEAGQGKAMLVVDGTSITSKDNTMAGFIESLQEYINSSSGEEKLDIDDDTKKALESAKISMRKLADENLKGQKGDKKDRRDDLPIDDDTTTTTTG